MLDIHKIKTILLTYLFLPVNTIILFAPQLQAQNKSDPSSFVTPSGNVYCALTGEEKNVLRCEIRSMLKPLPPQPYPGYCEFDWGTGFLLRQYGKPEILCISDTIGGSNYTLYYKKTWTYSGFNCVSEKTGLTCKNKSGNGFFLSRGQWNAF